MSLLARIHNKAVWAANGVSHSLEAARAVRAQRAPIDPDLVFIDSRAGLDFAGNMLRLVLELRRQYGSRYRIVASATRKRQGFVRSMLDAYGLNDVPIRRYNSAAYFRDLETAHFVLTDSTLPPAYLKREGQVVLNTWHGTPFKRMGTDSPQDQTSCDNVQRNLFFSDYLLYPSAYCMQAMAGAFSLEGLCRATVLLEGYPRNSIFFDAEARQRARESFGLAQSHVYVYMPTWTHGTGSATEDGRRLTERLRYLDRLLRDDEVLFLRLHDLAQASLGSEAGSFEHIRLFPSGIEAYEFLNIADCLVTDFSSVLYDFANAPGKIVLFTPDEQAYLDERGVYEQPVPFPFPKVATVDELVEELRSPKNYDDRAFLETYCPYDGPDSAAHIIRTVFGGEDACERTGLHDPTRKRSLFYAGGLGKNGITSSLRDLMAIMPDSRQCFVAYSGHLMKTHPRDLANLPPGKPTLCLSGSFRCATPLELAAIVAYYVLDLDVAPARSLVERFFRREARRCFTGMDFDEYIQFCGYERFANGLFQRGPAHTAIWVHNDMLGEIAVKRGQHRNSLAWAYRAYERVVCVSRDIVASTAAIGGRQDNVRIVENCIDAPGIRKRAEKPVGGVSFGRLCGRAKSIGDGGDVEAFLDAFDHVFVSIGRFSPEKNHALLIDAFARFASTHDGYGLAIVGGRGPLFESTWEHVEQMGMADRVLLVEDMDDPLPVLARCDLFLLSSRHEGQGLAIAEAAVLGIPVVSVDAPGCGEFTRSIGGTVTENSVEGLLGGMELFVDGKVAVPRLDEARYSDGALDSYLHLFD